MTNVAEFPQRALRAEPVQVELYVLGEDGLPVGRTDEGIVFDSNAIAAVEERFGDLDEFQKALSTKPMTTARAALAILLGTTEHQMGTRMDPALLGPYVARVGAAFAIANGVDPTIVQERLIGVEQQSAEMLAQVGAALFDSPSTSGSEPGSVSDEDTTSSGG